MKFTPRKSAVVGSAGLAATMALSLVAGTPAHAAIVNPSLVMSNNQSASSSTYTFTFTPGLTLTEMLTGFNGAIGMPAGTTGLSATNVATNVSIYENTGSGWGSALAGVTNTLNSAGNVIGIAVPAADFTSLTSVPELQVVVTNLTNPTVTASTTAGTCVADATSALTGILTSTFTSGTSGSGASFSGLTLADTACLTSTVVPIGTNGVTEQLTVAPVLNVSLPQTSDSFSVTPTVGGAAVSFPTDTITVATNAVSYSIETLINNTTSALKYDGAGSYSLPITATTGSCSSLTSPPVALGVSGTYSTLAASLTGLTNGTPTSVTYCGSNVSLTVPPGSYSGTITYLVVPSF